MGHRSAIEIEDTIELMKLDIEIAQQRGRTIDAYFIGGIVGFVAGVALMLAIWVTR